MGATVSFTCPVEGCSYTTYFRLMSGEETDAGAHGKRYGWLRDEHPNHPSPEETAKQQATHLAGLRALTAELDR
jgi:hypothetical protein